MVLRCFVFPSLFLVIAGILLTSFTPFLGDLFKPMMRHLPYLLSATAVATAAATGQETVNVNGINVDLNWYPPKQTWVNNLDKVLDGKGTGGIWFWGSERVGKGANCKSLFVCFHQNSGAMGGRGRREWLGRDIDGGDAED